MLQRWVCHPSDSCDQSRALQTHLRELGAQSSHGRPARSPTKPAWHQSATKHSMKHEAVPDARAPRSKKRRINISNMLYSTA